MTANFILDLMSNRSGALFFVIIIYDQCRMDHSRNPTKQRQKYAEEKTGNASGHQHRQWRQHHAEEISQRFHLFFFCSWVLGVRRWTFGLLFFKPLAPSFCSS